MDARLRTYSYILTYTSKYIFCLLNGPQWRSLASQSSHLNNAFFYYGELLSTFLFLFFTEPSSWFLSYCRLFFVIFRVWPISFPFTGTVYFPFFFSRLSFVVCTILRFCFVFVRLVFVFFPKIVFSLFFRFPPELCFCGPVFYTSRACCRRASTAITAQHGTAQSALDKAAKQVRADQSATTQASRVGESQHVVEHLQFDVLSKRTKKSKSDRPAKVCNHSQATAAVWCAKDFTVFAVFPISVRYTTTLSLRPFDRYLIHACGVRVVFSFHGAWSCWHLRVVRLHLKSQASLSASFIFCSILPCESGGSRPRYGAPCMYSYAHSVRTISLIQQSWSRYKATFVLLL